MTRCVFEFILFSLNHSILLRKCIFYMFLLPRPPPSVDRYASKKDTLVMKPKSSSSSSSSSSASASTAPAWMKASD